MKTAIVCEGGGMRGVFTAGVLQAFMDAGFVADELVGVSAGASNGASYVSGQKGRGYRTNVDYSADKRYASLQSYLKTGSYFGMDFIFGDIPDKLDPFDFGAFHASPTAYFAGVTDVATGLPVYFGKEDIRPGFVAVRASCSIPVLSPPVPFRGGLYLDGGISAPVPVDKALADGCERLLVILTQPRNYCKKPMEMRPVYHIVLRKYPNIVKALDMRHLLYNHTIKRIAQMEREGTAIIIAPKTALPVDRLGKNREGLTLSYQAGLAEGKNVLKIV